MAEATPGPWKIATPSMGFSSITGPNGELIFGLAAGGADEKQPDAVCDANARLIEAAPDLRDALADILRIARAASIGVTGNSKRIAKAEAALAKARGE